MTDDHFSVESDSASSPDFGASIGDVMAILLMFFILLYVAALLQLRKQEEEVVARRVFVIMALQKALEEKQISLELDPVTGDVSLTDSILFAEGSHVLKPEGKEFLRAFVPVYTNVIFSDPEIEHEVVRVVVEGHTSSRGNQAANLSLSLRRADSVTSFMARDLSFDHKQRLVDKLLAAGRGETEADQDADLASDRRVLFRFQFRGTEIAARLQDGALHKASP